MLDPRRLRAEPEAVARDLARRGFKLDLVRFRELEARRKQLQILTEALQAERNKLAWSYGNLVKEQIANEKLLHQDEHILKIQTIAVETTTLKIDLAKAHEALIRVQTELDEFVMSLPNIPDASVPDGRDENDNVELRRWGQPRAAEGCRDHVDLGEALRQMDFAAAAKLTGARFTVLRGSLAHMHRALTQFMLDVHTREHGYEELYVPYIVNAASLRGTGQLPKFGDDLFALKGEQDWRLVPTAEVPVTNLLRDEIQDADSLPRKWVAHTPCFRAEAGAAGKDTRGMIRQHQFEKVELVMATLPEKSRDAHEELTGHAENILKKLELPYRVVALCAGDMGATAAKTYDLEVWLPSQNRYREISSCSNFGDYQARRMLARFRNAETKKPELVHTLNGSGLAVGRTLVAVLENYQNDDGSIRIPAVLLPYFTGQDVIRPDC